MAKKPKYISLGEDVFKVKKWKGEDTDLEEGCAYHVKEMNLVLPYMGDIEELSRDQIVPGIYTSFFDDVREDSEIIYVRPVGKKMKRQYRPDKIYEIDPDYISQIIEEEGLKDVYDSALTAEMGEAFVPPISDSDNELLRIIKTVLQHKKVDIKNYSNRFRSDTDMNNFKRSLLAHSKMSMEKYNNACEIFDVEWEIIFRDKKGCANPMNYEGRITSRK